MWGMWWWPVTERTAGRDAHQQTEAAPRIVNETQLRGISPETARRTVRGQQWRDLVLAWRLSEVALARTRTCARAHAIVTLRAAILDEMEAQRPEALERWLVGEWRRCV